MAKETDRSYTKLKGQDHVQVPTVVVLWKTVQEKDVVRDALSCRADT
jgi:hypothetical protein